MIYWHKDDRKFLFMKTAYAEAYADKVGYLSSSFTCYCHCADNVDFISEGCICRCHYIVDTTATKIKISAKFINVI